MPVEYIITERGDPRDQEKPKKWYAVAKSTGETDLKSLGKEITQRSTVNHADTLAVLEVLTQLLSQHLLEGRIVRLGDFGSFRLSVSSEGAEKEEKFNSSLIKSAKIGFHPGEELKNMLSILKFEKVKS